MLENVRTAANLNAGEIDDGRTVTLNSHWPDFPYPGLRPFRVTGTSDESLIFYGRNAQKDDILARLNTAHTVVVVGPSGCGKSSLIKAGVIPALEAGLLTRAGHRWRTVQMRPARRPLLRLARAFASILPQPNEQSVSQFEALLRSERSGCWLAVDQLMPTLAGEQSSNWRVLLLIDQFEEIFGEQIADRDEVDQVVRLITRFFEKPHPNLYIVLTMRSDFIGHCANFQGLAEVVNASNYLIPVLKTRELRQAIERPAAEYHGLIEPALVQRIIADMGSGTTYHPDHLPLMQHALLWLWQRACRQANLEVPPRPDRSSPSAAVHLTLEDYTAYGGISGILDHHAGDILQRVAAGTEGEKRKRIAEIMFRRLSLRDAELRYRRTPTPASALCRLAACERSELQDVIGPFGNPEASLIELRPIEGSDDDLVDISHESLIRQWRQLKSWADDEAEKVRTFRELTAAAAAWAMNKKSLRFLRTGGELDVTRQWWDSNRPTKEWATSYGLTADAREGLAESFDLVAEFIDKSAEFDSNERTSEEARRLATATAEANALRNKYAAAICGAALVFTTFFALRYYQQTQKTADAVEELKTIRAHTLASRGYEALERFDATKGLLIALAGLQGTNGVKYVPQSEALAYDALQDLRESQVLRDDSVTQVTSVSFSRKNGALLTAGNDNVIRVWDTKDARPIAAIRMDGVASFFGARWSPDGERIVAGTRNGVTRLLTPCAEAAIRDWFKLCADNASNIVKTFGNERHRADRGVLSPDGRWLLTASSGASAKLWDVQGDGAEPVRDFSELTGSAWGMAFNADGTRFAIGGTDGRIRIFDTATISLVKSLGGDSRPALGGVVFSLIFHPRQPNLLLATSMNRAVALWNIDEERPTLFAGHSGVVYQGAFSPDGKRLATASEDRTVRLWHLDRPRDPIVLGGHDNGVWTVDFHPEGLLLASGSNDGTARIWRMQAALHPEEGQAGPEATVDARIAVSVDDKQIVVTRDGKRTVTLPKLAGLEDPVSAAVSPAGDRVAVAPRRGPIHVFDIATSQQIAALRFPAGEWRTVAFASDPGRVVATTVAGEEYSWRYFETRPALVDFAEQNLPRVGDERKRLDNAELCNLDLSAASCPAAIARRPPGS